MFRESLRVQKETTRFRHFAGESMAVIVINALSARLGGGQTYIRNLLFRVDDTHQYVVLVGPYNRELFKRAAGNKQNVRFIDCGEKQENPFLRLFWECFRLPSLLRNVDADVYYAAGGGTLNRVPKGVVSVTIVRNMLPFDERERARFPLFSVQRLKLFLLRRIVLCALKRCDKVIFISDYSRKVLVRLLPELDRKGVVIYHGVDERFFHPLKQSFDFSRFGITEGKFYLYVSIFNHYKAQAELVREWKILSESHFPYPLVLTGFHEPGYTEIVKKAILQTGQENNVLMTDAVSYDELPGFYAGARALVFASSCECCPNILLEMMAVGKPIFCSDFPPMPEIGGKSPIYFHPYREGDLAEKILRFENHFETEKSRQNSTRERAVQFSWDKTVEKTVQFLTEDLSQD